MADRSAIEWTDATWNPIRGCTRVSEGCRNCYAEGIAARFSGLGLAFEGLATREAGKARWTGKLQLAEDALLAPLRWRRPRRIFVNSMSDLFHEAMPEAWIDAIFGVMALCPQHTFQVLTKRPARMRRWFAQDRSRTAPCECVATLYVDHPDLARLWPFDEARAIGVGKRGWPLSNVWLGTSCEDQAAADARVPELLATPATVRFVSAEPLLGPIDFSTAPAWSYRDPKPWRRAGWLCPLTGDHHLSPVHADHRGARLDWIIVGGESGPRARPMHPRWATDIRDQCAAAGVSFFFKQWGAWEFCQPQRLGVGETVWPDGTIGSGCANTKGGAGFHMRRVGAAAAGRLLDGVEHNAMPEVRHG